MKENELEYTSQDIASPKLAVMMLVDVLFKFFRQTELHDPTNKIFDYCVENIMRVLSNLRAFPEFYSLDIFYRGEQIFVNELRLRPKPRQFRIYRYLIRFLRLRRVGRIKIFKEIGQDELKTCLWSLANVDHKDEKALDTAIEFIRSQGIEGFEIESLRSINQIDDEEKAALADVELLGVLLHEKIRKFAEVCFDNLERAKEFQLDDLNTYLADICSLPEEDLLQIFRQNLAKQQERYLSHLGADTCYALIAWGRSLGLPTGVLLELGGAGLLHPLVYLLRSKPDASPISEEEAGKLFQICLRLKEVWKITELQRLSLWEWTLAHGSEGVYQWNSSRCYAHFFSRMLRIVASFKRMTHLIPGQDALLPDEAIARMMGEKEQYDPTLLKLFVNWMGVYPVGTLVQLQSGEVAQVFAAGSDPLRFQRPIVSILKDSEGKILERPQLFDLTEMNEKLGIYRKSIKRSLRPEEADLPPEIFRMAPIGF